MKNVAKVVAVMVLALALCQSAIAAPTQGITMATQHSNSVSLLDRLLGFFGAIWGGPPGGGNNGAIWGGSGPGGGNNGAIWGGSGPGGGNNGAIWGGSGPGGGNNGAIWGEPRN